MKHFIVTATDQGTVKIRPCDITHEDIEHLGMVLDCWRDANDKIHRHPTAENERDAYGDDLVDLLTRELPLPDAWRFAKSWSRAMQSAGRLAERAGSPS